MERGAQPGNKNAAKSRLIEQALIRAIKQRDLKDGDGETLRRIAEAQIDKALSGDSTAFDKVADRLDGKPAQQVNLSGDLTTRKAAAELSDDELAEIAARSGK